MAYSGEVVRRAHSVGRPLRLLESAAPKVSCSNCVLWLAHRRVRRVYQDSQLSSCGAGTLQTQVDSSSRGFVRTTPDLWEAPLERKPCRDKLSTGCSQIEPHPGVMA